MMHLFPQTRQEWGTLLYFPFRAYVVIAWLGVELVMGSWPRRGGLPDCIPVIMLGYIACFVVLLLGGIIQLAMKREEGVTNLLFAAGAFAVGLHSCGYLAS